MYMSEVKTGMTSCEDKEPTIVKESAGTALVEGNNLIGNLRLTLVEGNNLIGNLSLAIVEGNNLIGNICFSLSVFIKPKILKYK